MAKIKISELSIGDWVEIYGAATKVWYLSQDDEVNDTTYDWVKPIPLTPEILEKNGWKKIVRNIKYQTWVKGDIYIRKYSAEKWYRLFIGRFEMKFNLYHTHQLQHALRLAGVGKEIKV